MLIFNIFILLCYPSPSEDHYKRNDSMVIIIYLYIDPHDMLAQCSQCIALHSILSYAMK